MIKSPDFKSLVTPKDQANQQKDSQSSKAAAHITTGAATQPAAVAKTTEEKLKELKQLNDAGLISKEVYLEQQKTILNKP